MRNIPTILFSTLLLSIFLISNVAAKKNEFEWDPIAEAEWNVLVQMPQATYFVFFWHDWLVVVGDNYEQDGDKNVNGGVVQLLNVL